MAASAIETVLCWSVECNVGQVEFFRGDDHYVFRATKETLRESLRLPGLCAADMELNLTFTDAANIAKALRQITPNPTSPAEVEPAVDEWVDGDGLMSDCAAAVAFLLVGSLAFWAMVFYLLWRVVA